LRGMGAHTTATLRGMGAHTTATLRGMGARYLSHTTATFCTHYCYLLPRPPSRVFHASYRLRPSLLLYTPVVWLHLPLITPPLPILHTNSPHLREKR
jgi:hypothetical protein